MPKMAKMTRSKKKHSAAKPSRQRKVKTTKKVALAKAEKPKGGFMWKLLENKERQLKEQAQKPKANPMQRMDSALRSHSREHSFSKFAGPRRRAG